MVSDFCVWGHKGIGKEEIALTAFDVFQKVDWSESMDGGW